MPKNILIFSDGTGQAGGIAFDEDRSNIYKLYRATRCGPDSSINPNEQVTFYDPGLGSPADGGFMFGKVGRTLYNIASQATGLGITANIIDCYAALTRLYRDGDRVFLFGFSRGAYSVRCLGGVLAHCGIPRHLPGNQPLPLDVKGSRKLARHAVTNVYQFCSSRPHTDKPSRQNFMLDTRTKIARRFREEYGSSVIVDGEEKANVFPYFIGIFDTVAALGRPGALVGIFLVIVASILVSSWLVSLLTGLSGVSSFGWLRYLAFESVLYFSSLLIAIIALIAYLRNYLKFNFSVPGYSLLQKIKTIHLADRKHKFYDYELNVNVWYAKHAISIDENRKDFARVRWTPNKAKAGERDAHRNLYFEQVWFSGVHADVGGGYPETECRLSDGSLYWMLAAASIIPNGITHDRRVLCLFPDAKGVQHDECKAQRIWQRVIRKLPNNETIMHKSVYERFRASEVVQYDVSAPYRPPNLAQHLDFIQYYDESNPSPQPAPDPKAVADNIELKWEKLIVQLERA
jgi:hypothetical protein